MIGTIEKNIKKDIDLKYSFFQIKTKKNTDIDNDYLESINCNNIEEVKYNQKLEIKEYKSIQLQELNVDIFQNLSKKNERIIIKNNDLNLLILLCNIDYNQEVANDKLYQNKLKQIANTIEIEFIESKKQELNFQLLK